MKNKTNEGQVDAMVRCESEDVGTYSDRFVNHFVPVIRSIRSKKDNKLLPSMNECIKILSKALQEYCT